MQIDNNWASPAIGDIRVPDRDLGRRLSRQPSVEMRAKMLGMDWTTLAASRVRLVRGAWMVSATVAVAAITSGLGSAGHTGPWLASAFVIAAALVSMLALRTVSRLPQLIARNDPSTADRYRAQAKLSPTRSLLGYRVRWILVRHAITTISAVALVVLALRVW
ncbi:MAG TPA: hypothetical protein VHU90_13005 [Galbitalea sp.]|jgi:hypothetical protein|nr:hypothetical protein [Galbitalea sp.]